LTEAYLDGLPWIDDKVIFGGYFGKDGVTPIELKKEDTYSSGRFSVLKWYPKDSKDNAGYWDLVVVKASDFNQEQVVQSLKDVSDDTVLSTAGLQKLLDMIGFGSEDSGGMLLLPALYEDDPNPRLGGIRVGEGLAVDE